ncbi:hypothetical protein LWM68_38970 [Niabella sp. W65]|nr:hypothetical protein [Niabella sp. W65]MCH7368193.1 hypothetical protein [Niabella sp. W65]ULT43804.1 hypothetical protein KRR40_10630 [Niabella sp. I65]
MLSEDKLQKIKEFTSTLSREELIWLNGYIAGQAGALQGTVPASGLLHLLTVKLRWYMVQKQVMPKS